MDQRKVTLRLATIILSAAALLPVSMAHAEPQKTSGKVVQNGRASWYGPGFHGRKTASGETFNTHALTAAHRTLPFGTKVRVVNKRTGKSVVVRINDRGPYAHGRVIDLSRASAQAIGLSGVAPVTVAEL